MLFDRRLAMTIQPLFIRPYRSEDKSSALKIWRDASAIAHPFFSEEQFLEQRQLVGDVYLEKAETWVAETDEGIVGFIGLLDNWIGGLFVHPSAQGDGIGRALVEHAMSVKGELTLEVYEANTGARAFYRRLGFQAVARRDIDDNGLPFPLLRMQRAVAQ